MRVLLLSFLLAISPFAHADHNWFTIAGDPSDVNNDYIQLDPSEIGKEGALVTIPLRVSRAGERTSQDGIKFRSFASIAGVDCVHRTARFLRASFYKEPAFQGTPFQTKEYGDLIRPVLFRQIPGEHAERTVRAACKAVS